MEITQSKKSRQDVEHTNNLNYSKSEELIRNILIPNSVFMAKWEKDKGYAIGIENVRLTKHHSNLNDALSEIGYGVSVDADGDEILTRAEVPVNYEMIVRIVTAILTIEENKKGDQNNG